MIKGLYQPHTLKQESIKRMCLLSCKAGYLYFDADGLPAIDMVNEVARFIMFEYTVQGNNIFTVSGKHADLLRYAQGKCPGVLKLAIYTKSNEGLRLGGCLVIDWLPEAENTSKTHFRFLTW